MLEQINKLHHLAHKEVKQIIGLMSGTSFDGLDIAHCSIEGNGRATKVKLNHFITFPYSDDFKSELKKIFSIKYGEIELLTLLHSKIGKMHGELVNQALKNWNISKDEVDCIASHGQTIYHAPSHLHQRPNYGNSTLQIGDGDHLAVETKMLVISDFRMKHIAAGGEGAPLAIYGDYMLFSDLTENRVMLNIGGISNFSWIPNDKIKEEYPCFSTDVGPGNTMMDAYVQKNFSGLSCDMDSSLALKGMVNQPLFNALSNHDFFTKNIPKTIGPELFNLQYLENAQADLKANLTHEDILATLNFFTSSMIVAAIKKMVPQNYSFKVYASGGGIHNPLLMDNIAKELGIISIEETSSLGIDGDAKEAILFAILANECLSGTGLGLGNQNVGMPDVTMGKICFPK
jgi:anhydro-N-acetylmuramic acid kinase